MEIENVELMHECSPEHLRMGTEILKSDKETEEEGMRKNGKMEIGKVDQKKNLLTALL